MDTLLRTLGHYIDGRPTGDDASRYGDVANPARGEIAARVAFSEPADVDAAVSAARRSSSAN